MARRTSVKTNLRRAQLVGVIASRSDLRFALRMADPPDLFEIRLDHFADSLGELEKKMSILRGRLIITARHPQEGGANRLPAQQRRELLLRFLPWAQYVDVELRSAKELRPVLDLARKKNVRLIVSFHDFGATPTLRTLIKKARAAHSLDAAILKIATRTDTPAQLARLFEFVANHDVDLALSAMGMGKLGAVSRVILAQLGSVLTYAALGPSAIEGQLSIQQLRSAFTALKIA